MQSGAVFEHVDSGHELELGGLIIQEVSMLASSSVTISH